MKKFFKDYLGLLAAVGLAGGSLFAFNISTSIDNALQVIKTIWVTSDGTTSNPPFVTMDGSGKYVSIGTTASGETLNVSGTAYIQNGNRGWEYLAEQLYTGIQNIGGRYRSGTKLWHQGVAITDRPLSYIRWTDDSNNNEMIAQINQDSAGLKYSDNRQLQSLGQTFSNLIGVARDKLEVMFDMYNFNGYRNGITIDQDGLFYENETGPIHTFDRSGHVGINTMNPLHAIHASGDVMLSDTNVLFHLSQNNALVFGLPSAITRVSNTGLNQTSNIVAYNDGTTASTIMSTNDTQTMKQSYVEASNNPSLTLAILQTENQNIPTIANVYAFDDTNNIGSAINSINFSNTLPNRAFISTTNGNEARMRVESGIINPNDSQFVTELIMDATGAKLIGSGSFNGGMFFDGLLGSFSFGGTSTPDNTIDIKSSLQQNTLGLRFSSRGSNSGQILGLNDDGDVVMLGNIGGFGGGGPNYWTQNGNDLYPSTLTNNIGIGTSAPSETLSLSGTALMENNSRGWEFVNDTLVPGLNRIGGWFTSGTQYVQNTITDVYNGLPIANMGWYDTATNEESNFSAFQQSATMHYNSDRTSTNSGLRNGIDVTPNDVEIKYDQNNISGTYIELNLGPLGFGVNGFGFTHMFTNSGYVGINTINPSHTLSVSGTFIANDGFKGFEVSDNMSLNGASTNIPGAMASIASGDQVGFMFAGNPSANPIFNAGVGGYLGFVDLGSFDTDRTIVSAKSGDISLDITQNNIDVASINVKPSRFSIESNGGRDNLFVDFITNRIGINNASPQKALDVNGAIVSSIVTLTGADALSGDGTYFYFVLDVQDVNTIVMQPEAGQVFVIMGFANGTPGQEIRVISNSIVYNYNSPSADRIVMMQPHYAANLMDIISIFGAPITTNQIFMHRYDTFGNDTSQENDGGTYIAGCTNQTTTANTSCFIGVEFIFDGSYRYPTARF